MKKIYPILKNEVYHIHNRGVEKRVIFLEDTDFMRFTDCLVYFNSEGQTSFRASKRRSKKNNNSLVEIICYALMDNHFHILAREISEGGLTKFMSKISTSYAMYFNKKYSRVGPLFQGTYQINLLEDDESIVSMSKYIHLNPLRMFNERHKRGKERIELARRFLHSYPWSSYKASVGLGINEAIIKRHDLFGMNEEEYRIYIEDFVESVCGGFED